MQLDYQELANQEQNLNQAKALNLDIQIVPVEDYYLFNFLAKLNSAYAHYFMNQTFILFVLQLRSGMSQRAIKVVKNCILQFCQQAMERGLNGFGFIINGEYFTIKRPNLEAIRDILTANMVVSQQDNYLFTLRKLRHVLQSEVYKYQKVIDYIDMVFFTSYVEIDHSLGVKKRSYIDYLNEHSDDCDKQVNKIYSTLQQKYKRHNAHVIGLQKRGQTNQNYSLVDRDLYYKIHTKFGKYSSLILFYYVEQEDCVNMQIVLKDNLNSTSSFTKMIQGFRSISATVLASSFAFNVQIPLKQKKCDSCNLIVNDSSKFQVKYDGLYKKEEIQLQKIKNNEVVIKSKKIQKTLQRQQNIPQQNINNFYSVTSHYTQLKQNTISKQIIYLTRLYNYKLAHICQKLKQQIVSFKRIYQPNNKNHLQMIVNQQFLKNIHQQIFYIEKRAKQIYQQIFDPSLFTNSNQNQSHAKRKAFQLYSQLKKMLDISQQVLMDIYKKTIKNDQIGKISKAVTFWGLKNSLKNKLIRRINLNPKMIDQTYSKVHQIVTKNNYSCLQTIKKDAKHAIGYCIKSGINFATALRKQDCLGILVQVQRPDSAIADPGRIKVRQISPFAMSVNNFFNVYHYGIDKLGELDQQKGGQWVRQFAKLQKENYQEMWDYWALAQKKYTVTALIPVYLCKQHWQVAKLLMKPCLGWTATGQPLGYTFSQAQTIPFMVLSLAIRKLQQYKYQIQTLQGQLIRNEFRVTQYSLLQQKIKDKKFMWQRMKDLCWVLQETCYQIMKDMSSEMFEQKLSQMVIQKYKNYVQYPLQRTIDIISNNSSFLSQLYCVIKLQMMKKPQQNQFHQFFKRLIQEQLRRQTDGWNQEQTQDKFINKLLNSQVQNMDVPEYIVLDSAYYDKFQQLKKGQIVHKTYFEIKRAQLQMMVTKNGKFNDTQRMLLIQYKRLYQNKVLWMWYVRFRLYSQIQRIKIHKWKCIDLINSYMLFTMIIQNKKQRKNFKRRQAIQKKQYVDPFNVQKATQFLETEFIRVRANKQKQNIQILYNKKFGNAAATFAYTKSLQQAAGTLINIGVGQQAPHFYRQLQRGQAIRLPEKIQMILLGQHNGVTLFKGWKMSRKKNNKLRKVYPQVYLKYGYLC